MAQLALAPGLDTLAGVGAKSEAIAKLAQLEEVVDAALARRKSNGLLRRAIKAWQRGDVVRAGRLSLEAVDTDSANAQAYHVLGMALEKMGHTHKALVTYEKAFALDPDDPELLINLGLTAWNLKITEGAEKMFRLYIERCPNSPLGYNNLGSIQCDMGHASIAIETLRAAIYRMPEEAVLWNSLATVLAESGRAEESLVFYREAIRLEPDFSRPYHNMGFAYQHLGRLPEALEAYDCALERAVDEGEKIESRHSRSICLIGMGQLEEGFREYEIRNNQRFRAYVQIISKAPLWQGEDLTGKRILVIGEQGLGDEFMFANILPDLARAVGPDGTLQIAVDKRLTGLFQRSFPAADVGAYDDRQFTSRDGNHELRLVPWAEDGGMAPDFHLMMGSALQYLRKDVSDFPHEAFLIPDPARVEQMRAQLAQWGPGPFVGMCWRSMMLGVKRSKYYSVLDDWGPILKTPGITFVNLQYGDCQDELARATAQHGIAIRQIEGLDLKNDIEGAAALSAALDLVISAPTAAAATAGSVGAEVWFLTAGRTWPQLGTDEFPWYRKSHVFAPDGFGEWESAVQKLAADLTTRFPAR